MLIPEYIGIDLNILTGQKSFVFQMERPCLHSSRMMKMKHDAVGNLGRNCDVHSEGLNGTIRCVSVVTEVDRCTQSGPSGQKPARKKTPSNICQKLACPNSDIRCGATNGDKDTIDCNNDEFLSGWATNLFVRFINVQTATHKTTLTHPLDFLFL